MMATNCLKLCTALAVCAVAGTTTSVLAGGPKDATKQVLTSGIKITPKAVAGARLLPDGRISMTSSWLEYTGRTTRDTQTDLAFDNYEPQGPSGSAPGYPTDGLYGLDCGMGTGRWFFGTAYCNVFYTNDIQKFTNDAYQGKSSTRAQWAWYFACDGASSEHCLVAVFTAEGFDDTCSGPDVGGSGYSGVIADFGTIGCNPGGYYFTDVDLSTTSLSYTLPHNNGAYQVFFLQNFSTSAGSGTLSSCAQPMLWGTKPGNKSQQGPIEWDDDGGVGAPGSGDGSHTAPTECYDMTFGVCPDPLGGMFCFYGEKLASGCRPDCNLDTKATVNDFICFQSKWKTKDPYGDYDKNGLYNINDFISFQAAWKKWQQTGDCGS